MKRWWIHYKEKVPVLGSSDEARVENLTGRIPFFPHPLLNFPKKPFNNTEQEFWMHPDLPKDVQNFALAELKNKAINRE